MCMVRLKQEGHEGKYMIHYLIMSMWHDIQERGKIMGVSITVSVTVSVTLSVYINTSKKESPHLYVLKIFLNFRDMI